MIKSKLQASSGVLPLIALLAFLSAVSLDLNFSFLSFKPGNILILLLAAIFFLFQVYSGRDNGLILKVGVSDLPLLLFVVLIFLSSYWSPSKVNSILQGVLYISIYIIAQTTSRVPLYELLRVLFYIGFYLSVASLMMYFINPSVALQPSPSGDIPELRGVFHHQLRLGLFAGVLFGLLVISVVNKDWIYIFRSKAELLSISVVLFLVLLFSFARLYGFFSLLAILLAVLIPSRSVIRLMLLMLVFLLVFYFVYNWNNIAVFLQGYGFDTTLTGRSTVWLKSLELASERPILGWGYPSFEMPVLDFMWNNYRPAHPHNSFIQAYFELGVIGFSIACALVCCNYLEVIGLKIRAFTTKTPYSLYLFLMMFFCSLVGANYASKPSFLLILFMIVLYSERTKVVRVNI